MTPSKPDDGIFVEAGSFRIDSARAIEKIRDFQAGTDLPPELLWIRAANAAGAEGIRLKRTLREFTVSFDGAGFSRRFLEDPFLCLLDDREGWPRHELHCARALLRELREKPEFITVLSGTEGLDRRLSLTGVLRGQRRLSKASRDGDLNEIRIRWPLWRSLRIARADSESIERRVEQSRAEIFFEGKSISADIEEYRRAGRRYGEAAVGKFGFRGRVRPLEVSGNAAERVRSVLHPSLDGVSIEDGEFDNARAAVEAWVDSGRWGMNASQEAFTEDESFERMREAVDAATVSLMRREIRTQTNRAARTGGLLISQAARLNALFDNGRLRTPEEASGHGEALGALAVDLRRTLWLRDAALRAGRLPKVLKALLERTPLFWSVRGFPASVRFLSRRAENVVLFDDSPWLDCRADAGIVWCLFGPEDRRWLMRLVGPRLRRARP